MNFTKLVPNVFYTDINDGIKLFVNCLEFTIEHEEIKSAHPFCVLEKDGLRINLFQDEQLAKEHYPEFRIVTNDIEEVYALYLYLILTYFTQILTGLHLDRGLQRNLQ